MAIVIELQQEALSKDTDLLSLLRKAYLVARKLKLKEFEEWINHELNGYGLDAIVPNYRIYHGEIYAWNPYNGWIPVIFERDLELNVHEARDTIASLIDVYDKSDGKAVRVYFSDTINAYLSTTAPFPTRYSLQISPNTLFSTFESIRNTILDWAITLEENGILGEGLGFTDDEVAAAEKSPAINNFINNFYGNVDNTQMQQGTDCSNQDYEK